jgi:hypothetical protein
MPNLTDTQLQAAITKASNSLIDKTEFRDYQHGTVKRLLDDEPDVFMNVEKMKQSREQPTKVDMHKSVYTASAADKSHNHAAAAFPDSFTKDIVYIPMVQTFKVSYKQADNNRLGYDGILAYELKNKLQSFYRDISAAALAFLAAEKSQVAVDSVIAFDGVGFKFDNPTGEADFFFENMKSAMLQNRYPGMLNVVGDQRNATKYRRLAAQGAQNATNQAWQLPGIDYVEEPQMAVTALGEAYAFAKGTVGMTTWNEPLNRKGSGSIGNNEGLFSTLVDPILGHVHDLHVVRAIADTSGSAGNVQDIVDEYELTTFYALEGAWESTANASSIYKFVQG